MYHLNVAVTDLVPPQSGAVANLPRLPILEGLMARASSRVATLDWRHWALERLGCTVSGRTAAVAGLMAERAGASVEGKSWFILSPLHLVAGMTTVHHHAAGPVPLDGPTAQSVAAALARDFSDPEFEFLAIGDLILLGIQGVLIVETQDPARLAGRDLAEGFARGADARRLARLGGEFELWLHGRSLTGRDGRSVQALHPWGHGDARVIVGAQSPRLLTDDPILRAASATSSEPTSAFDVWSVSDLLTAGRGFVDADAHWAAPLRARLNDGEIRSVDLHMGTRIFRMESRQWLRFWRRVRPWWEQLV
jgi:hypothetical protein